MLEFIKNRQGRFTWQFAVTYRKKKKVLAKSGTSWASKEGAQKGFKSALKQMSK